MRNYFKQFKNHYPVSDIVFCTIIIVGIIELIDLYNLPSILLNNVGYLIISICLALLFIVKMFQVGIFSTIKLSMINVVDKLIACGLISLAATLILLCAFDRKPYKIIICIVCAIVFIIFLLYRQNIIKKSNIVAENKLSCVLDIKDFLDGKISNIEDKPVYFCEEDVNYDLLGRDEIINNLYFTITNCKHTGKFVISLEGAWGSGKTTIINNVKRILHENNPDIIVVDEFDPWVFIDQESMFRAMFDTLLNKSGLKFNATESKKIINGLADMLFSNVKYADVIQHIYTNKSSEKDFEDIKESINDYLLSSEKSYIFIIDNIDRADEENILLLFKLVGNVFDFKGLTYVLSFDSERVKKVLETNNNMEYSYLKKIIQMQIKVPTSNSEKLNELVSSSIHQLLKVYGDSNETISEIENCMDSICTVITDLRDLKRVLNSIISFSYKSDKNLSRKDIFIMELIKCFNNALYQSIFKNREYYISSDLLLYMPSFESTFDQDSFNRKSKEYFDNIFVDENNKKYIPLLSEIFPYVKRYQDNMPIKATYPPDNDYNNTVKGKRIKR